MPIPKKLLLNFELLTIKGGAERAEEEFTLKYDDYVKQLQEQSAIDPIKIAFKIKE